MCRRCVSASPLVYPQIQACNETNLALADELPEGLPEQVALEQADVEQVVDLEQVWQD